MKRICVYCGSRSGLKPEYSESARLLGQALVERDIGLVYGGASIGLMGDIANSVISAGGEVIGVIPQSIADKEVAHTHLTELRVVESMHERKATMAELSDGFIALPGGLGTLEELLEILTWGQLGFHNKPCGLLNIEHYYDHLMSFLQHSVEHQFVKPIHRSMLQVENSAESLLNALESYQAPNIEMWIGPDET